VTQSRTTSFLFLLCLRCGSCSESDALPDGGEIEAFLAEQPDEVVDSLNGL